jgi:dTDP-4-dehydrorhamnose 3,5-epimerase
MYVPRGFAHGFLTLEDNSTVHYHISDYHAPEAARGLRWNDPAIGIDWPCPPAVLSDRDATYPYMPG